MTDFCVVGGGIGGLVAARTLAAGGASVVVHEASARLGGTVAAHRVAGIDLDAGAESFAVRDGVVAGLLSDLGLGGDVVAPEPVAAWLQPVAGAPVPLPATALLGIPADPLAPDVVAVIGRDAAAHAVHLDAQPLGTIEADLRLGALVRRRLGDAVRERLVEPVVHGVHSRSAEDLALERAHPGLRAALAAAGSLTGAVAALRASAPPGSAVAGLRGGVHRMVPALADDLARRGVDVRLGSRIDDPWALPGMVVVAAPGQGAPAARRIDLVTLVVDEPRLDAAPRGSGLLVAAGAPVSARALTHATAKWGWLRAAAGGLHVLRLSYDAVPADPVVTARADASALLGTPLPEPVAAAHVTWSRPAPATPPQGRVVVGETVAGSGIAGIVAHARRTAERLLHGAASG